MGRCVSLRQSALVTAGSHTLNLACFSRGSASRLQPDTSHRDLLGVGISGGFNFVRGMARRAELGHDRIQPPHRRTKSCRILFCIDHDDFASRQFRRESSVAAVFLFRGFRRVFFREGVFWYLRGALCFKGRFFRQAVNDFYWADAMSVCPVSGAAQSLVEADIATGIQELEHDILPGGDHVLDDRCPVRAQIFGFNDF
jgi:hypothetical protein